MRETTPTGAPASITIVAIIPLYNGARFIEQAVASVLSQTRPPDEFIVVDDGSVDDGPAIVERLSATSTVRLLRKANGGQSSARNFGVVHSVSSHIALLDQDDFWYSDHLTELQKPFESSHPKSLGWSYANLDEGDEAGTLVTSSFLHSRPARHPKTSIRDCVADDMFVLPSAALIAREAFGAVGGFDERLAGYEDDDLFLRLLLAGYENVFIDKPLSMWRIYKTSTTSTPLMTRSRMVYARKLLETLGPTPTETGTLARDAIAPRFASHLLGEYLRAAERDDPAGMRASLTDLRTVIIPHLARSKQIAFRSIAAMLSLLPVGRFVAKPQVTAALRRLSGRPTRRS